MSFDGAEGRIDRGPARRQWAASRRPLKAISNPLRTERGEVTKGQIHCRGERVDGLTPNDLVRRGVIQVMEGGTCFGHLTVEENLLTGAYIHVAASAGKSPTTSTRCIIISRASGAGARARLATRRRRAADDGDRPCPDEPAQHHPARRAIDGPGAAARRGDIRDREEPKRAGKVSIPLAEQNTNVALRYAHYGYILENG